MIRGIVIMFGIYLIRLQIFLMSVLCALKLLFWPAPLTPTHVVKRRKRNCMDARILHRDENGYPGIRLMDVTSSVNLLPAQIGDLTAGEFMHRVLNTSERVIDPSSLMLRVTTMDLIEFDFESGDILSGCN